MKNLKTKPISSLKIKKGMMLFFRANSTLFQVSLQLSDFKQSTTEDHILLSDMLHLQLKVISDNEYQVQECYLKENSKTVINSKVDLDKLNKAMGPRYPKRTQHDPQPEYDVLINTEEIEKLFIQGILTELFA